MGVAEHTFDVPLHGKNVTWHLFDVGGARGQRHTWVPFCKLRLLFHRYSRLLTLALVDDANAIIFVAPISAFDQVSS